MRPVTITQHLFEAPDGTRFSTEEECVQYEGIVAEVAVIMAPFPPVLPDPMCSFGNGGGYYQWNPDDRKRAYLALIKLALRYVTAEPFQKWLEKSLTVATIDESWPARAIQESAPRPIWSAFHRILCIEESTGREWGQRYFTAHPNEGKQVRLNP